MNFIELIKTIFLGIVEGITEWLPISSTGHMILVDEFMQLNVSSAFREFFFVIIQLGAILAVIFLYFHKLNPFSMKKTKKEREDTYQLWFKVLVACLPAGVIGILFNDQIEAIFNKPFPVACMLILYGILFIVIENKHKGKQARINTLKELTFRISFLIGIFQVLSLMPGTSRSGATILGAILIGTSREVAAEFTFFLAIPAMLGASLLKLVKFGFAFTTTEIMILIIGMITAFLVSIFAIKFLMNYIKKNNFKVFGWYRIILGALVLIYFLF